ncbi:MAG: metalloregulator ArsR/SmtB family transcription factor [Parvularculaceae bacterium]
MTSLDSILSVFRAAGEETRLRILVLLAQGELTVSELTQILAQSQPRVSRHLKVLAEAGMVERYREGAWVFYRLSDAPEAAGALIAPVVGELARAPDRVIARDTERLRLTRQARADAAADYFSKNAASWDEMRKLHSPDAKIERAMAAMLGPEPIGLFVDLGTGTGRILEILADAYERGVGFDLSVEMLAVARANLERAGVTHAQVRQGDLFNPPLGDGEADVVAIHQVLHYLDDPQAAVVSAARLLRPGGRLLIVDFAPHELEFLREQHAHRRLGFADDEVRGWCAAAGLDLARVDNVPPPAKARGALTVKLWLCAATAPAHAQTRKKSPV